MTPIPQPPSIPFLGNLFSLNLTTPILSFQSLAATYGAIYRLALPGSSTIVVNTQELCNEICDEKRFHKEPTGPLLESRAGVGDAMFTAFKDEENWRIAHRILMPKFAPHSVKEMFDEMHDIACQLVSKWARFGPSYKIDPVDAFTRVSWDTIALCAMDRRFNSLYNDALHPFTGAITFFLGESGRRSMRPKFVSNYFYRADTRRYWESVELMKDVAREAIDERKRNPKDKKDLLNAMLCGEDSKAGQKMTELSVIQNTITFLGHETTAGMLSFLFALLLKNPRTMEVARREVDGVVGGGAVTVEHMDKLPYLTACLREVLRLFPSAPGFQVVPNHEHPVSIGHENYRVQRGDILRANLPAIHRDPLVYGDDVDDFRPERMLKEKFDKLPPNSWKPFGNGVRTCIGKAFAWQEGLLIAALIIQNFELRLADPGYEIEISQALTIKPKDFYMYATLRNGDDPIAIERRLRSSPTTGRI